MKKFLNYIKESQEIQPEMSGKHGFEIFLELINDNDIEWTKKSYMNTGEYLYFFRSEHIQDNQGIAEQLEFKKSLKTAYLTLNSIRDKRVCFYFGVRNNKLEYGFYDEISFTVYKIGIFEVNNFYFKKFPKEANLSIVRKALENVNIKTLELLRQIRTDLGSFWTQLESKTEIIDEKGVRRALPIEYFKIEDRTDVNMMSALDYNIKEFEWKDRVHAYVEITEENIYFFIRLI
jgi:hypothetical protein